MENKDVPATAPVIQSDPKFDEAIRNILTCQTQEELYKKAKSYCNWFEGARRKAKKGVPA